MLICAVAAPETETDKPPLVQPENVIVAVLLLTEVLNDCDVKLVKDNPLGDPQAVVLAARNRQFVPSQTSTLVSVVFHRSVPTGEPEQLEPADAAAVPRIYWGYCQAPLTHMRLLPPAGWTRLAPLLLPLIPAVAGPVQAAPCTLSARADTRSIPSTAMTNAAARRQFIESR